MLALALTALITLQGEESAEARAPVLEPAPRILVGESVLGQLNEELLSLYNGLRPALVAVRVPVQVPFQDRTLEQEVLLSGVVLDESGLFVAPGIDPGGGGELPDSVMVTRYDGVRFAARPVRYEPMYGLTLYYCDKLGLTPPPLASCDTQRVGSLCFAIGNAFDLEGSFTLGVVSGRDRGLGKAQGLLQVSNPLNPGDGGGLLADHNGEVIGVLLTSLRDAARHQTKEQEPTEDLKPYRESEQISFAVPIATVRTIFAEELGYEPAKRPWLGVSVEIAPSHPMQKSLTSVVVTEVQSDSPAEEAGLRKGDVLLGMNGEDLYTQSCLLHALQHTGSRARVRAWRTGKEKLLTLVFQP